MPTATRHRRASGSYSPFQNARAVAAQSKRPGVSVSIRCAWPYSRGMSKSEPAITTPTQTPYRRARKWKPIAIVRANSITDAIRRAGMSFIQRPKSP